LLLLLLVVVVAVAQACPCGPGAYIHAAKAQHAVHSTPSLLSRPNPLAVAGHFAQTVESVCTCEACPSGEAVALDGVRQRESDGAWGVWMR
jgi:hypothetical protein